MKLFFATFAFSLIACSSGSSFKSLLGVDNLIPTQFETRSDDALGQLKALLRDPAIVSTIYANYRRIFNKSNRNNIQVFAENILEIAEHNAQFEAGSASYTKEVNKFADLTEAEFHGMYTGAAAPESDDGPVPTLTSIQMNVGADVPESLNWTEKGTVGPIKDQSSCGSCVTFATAGVIESAFAKNSPGQPIYNLSEQELLDCTADNNGCNGGWYDPAFKEVKDYGLASGTDYKYIKKQNRKRGWFGLPGAVDCQRDKYKRAIPTVQNWGSCQENKGDEEALKKAIATYGPVAVAVAADRGWSSYKKGIYDGSCDSRVTHAVMVTGYGTENGKDFWIIKNSWATSWGEQGYMRLIRGKNKCLVADHCYYAEA